MPEVLCLSSWRTRKSIFRNKDLKRSPRWLCPSLCNSLRWHSSFSSISQMPEGHVFHTRCPAKLSSQRWSSVLLMIPVTFSKRPDAATLRCYKWRWHCFVCFVSATQGSCWKFPDDHGKQFTYLWEKGGAEPEPRFHSVEGKKPQSFLNSLFWLLNSMLWSECISL